MIYFVVAWMIAAAAIHATKEEEEADCEKAREAGFWLRDPCDE